MDCNQPGFLALHYLLEFAQTHVHWVHEAIQPSHPLSPQYVFLRNILLIDINRDRTKKSSINVEPVAFFVPSLKICIVWEHNKGLRTNVLVQLCEFIWPGDF